jgi:tRNA modification GTPase
MPNDAKTFAALTTPPGRGGIAVIVLAGPGAEEIVRKVFRPWKSHMEDLPGALRLGHIVDGDRILDEVVLCRVSGAPADLSRQKGDRLPSAGACPLFPAELQKGDRHRLQTAAVGASPLFDHFAGEFYEINIHGGPLVARQTMDLLQRAGAEINRDSHRLYGQAAGRQNGDSPPQTAAGDSPHFASPLFPPAHPQWNNPAIGREMLAALPHAHSELVVTALSRQWSAGISKLASDFLSSNRPIRAPQTPQSSIVNRQFCTALQRAADSLPVFRKLLAPREVVVLGPPNAGKSTLVNALVGRQVSIVHAQPGTTRDWVRELALIRGVPVYLTDTAGLWEESSGIDAQAMQRAREAAAAADLVLLAGAEFRIADCGFRIEEAEPILRRFFQSEIRNPKSEIPPVLRLATKCDICAPAGTFDVAVSARTEQGMDELKSAILRALGLADIDPTAPMAFTERQAELLRQAAEHPDQAAGLMRQLLG